MDPHLILKDPETYKSYLNYLKDNSSYEGSSPIEILFNIYKETFEDIVSGINEMKIKKDEPITTYQERITSHMFDLSLYDYLLIFSEDNYHDQLK